MKKIVELAGQPLEWRQPAAFSMNYDLRHGDDLVATLEFRSMFGSFATGTSDDGCWTFKRVGFWQTRATIRPSDRDEELGSFRNNFWSGGGGLELPDGRKFLATTNLWKSKLEFQNESEAALFSMKNRGLIHLASDLMIFPEATRIPELPWMVLLGMYVVVMMQMDSAGGSAAAAG